MKKDQIDPVLNWHLVMNAYGRVDIAVCIYSIPASTLITLNVKTI
jgi:hypothetical protein